MRHEKVIKGTDGREYTINVWVHVVNNKPSYLTILTNDMGYESTYKPTPAEILEAKLELWNKIKPC